MKQQTRSYRRVSASDRYKIEALKNAKVSVAQIAKELGFSKVTIYAELKRGAYQHRNSDWTETTKYSAYKAQRNADYNATSKGAQLKIANDHAFAAVLGFIKENQLDFETSVCRVTLYSYIDKGVFRRISNKNLLRKSKKKKYKQIKRVKKLPRVDHSIEKRPKEIQDRISFGHWELDSVIGKQIRGKTILSLTERKTRMQLVLISKDKSSMSTVNVLNQIERKVGVRNFKKIFQSITCDNGCEFANTNGMEFSPVTGKQRTTVYYCHPYCSSERGSNENQNGFIRRFILKGTAIGEYTPNQVKQIQDFINYYPRGIFDYKSSADLFQIELAQLGIKNNLIFF